MQEPKERVMTGTELVTQDAGLSTTAGAALARIVPEMPWMTRIEEHPSWEILSQLRVTLRASVALNRFKVRDLLTLKEGQVFESVSPETEDVAVMVGKVQLGWSEFEVPEQRMAVRLTRLG
jgi:flagellar motor switch/type III secretory pathway protein FliN